MRRAIPITALAAVAAGAAALAAGAGGDDEPAAAAPAAGPTAPVERRTLTERERADGTLGYSGERTVLNRLAGTITWLPSSGARIRRGERLLEVDERPVILMHGRRPAHRRLARGISGGEDVRQLERNLVALGFDPDRAIVVDRTFGAATAAAVRRWQEELGLPRSGAVELGRVAFLPGTRRVTELKAGVGAAAGGGAEGGDPSGGGDRSSDPAAAGVATEVMRTTSTRQVVTLDLDAADASVAREGRRVDVELPDGSSVRGRVARVGTVAETAGDEEATGEDAGTPTITVTVTLGSGQGGARLDRAPVSVELERESRRDVLAVPVTALLAQRGGGYAVEVRTGRGGRLVAVEPGLFADGYVEVRGRGLRAGDRVTVPAA